MRVFFVFPYLVKRNVQIHRKILFSFPEYFKNHPKLFSGKGLSRTGPNVAVITVKAGDSFSSDSSSILKEKIKSKMKTRLKEKMKLSKQVN